MNNEIKAYLSLQAKVAAAFNFFINGMITALIYHKADVVPTDTVSLAIDLISTCFLIFMISMPFSKANLKSSKTTGILESRNKIIRFLSRLFSHPFQFCLLTGLAEAIVLFAIIEPVFMLFELNTIRFDTYITVKAMGCALLGGSATLLELYAGMYKTD